MSEEEAETNNVAEPELSDSGETMMSCETGTQYSAQDTITSTSTSSYSCSYRIPDYDFSLQLPVSLREEDCDWDDEDVTCPVCDRSFPTPVHLQSHMIKHRHWLCSHCEQLFNSSCELEYHKVRRSLSLCHLTTLYFVFQDCLGHWSDDYETDDSQELDNQTDLGSDTITHNIIEQETAFGPNVDKNILLCHQF